MTPVELLTNEGLIKEASLKETSLFTLAKQIKLEEPVSFVKKFTSYDREVRSK